MPETIITVRGQHSAWFDAERAIVTISVNFDGPARDAVFASATTAADAVTETIASLHDSEVGPITWWSADSVRVWSQRPWNDQGAQLDPVHYAALDLTAKFSNFTALSGWIEKVVEIPGVSVGGIQWSLTEGRITAVTAEVRSRAVKDAVAKASIYAQSIGLGTVSATAVADPGMLGDGASPQPGFEPRMAMKSMDSMGGGSPLALKPQQIEVSTSVDARFVAS